MKPLLNSASYRGRMLRLVICLFSLLMLITLPAGRAHQLQAHYRTTQIRRSLQRHAYVAQAEAGASDEVSYEALVPPRFAWMTDPAPPLQVYRTNPGAIPSPNPRLLLRLKLGPPSSGSQDPLVISI
jgi:hypothetical protein